MVQFHLEVISNLIATVAYACLVVLCFFQGGRRKNTPLIIIGIFSCGSMATIGFQAVSYMLIVDDPPLAMNLKLASGLCGIIPTIIWFAWMDYVQYERVRLFTILPVLIVAVAYVYNLLTTEAFRVYIYIENDALLGVSIGRVGLAIIWDSLNVILLYIGMIWYFTMLLRHAPPTLKPTTRFLATFLFATLIAGNILIAIARSLPDNGLAFVLYSFPGITFAVTVLVLITIVVRVPQLLYMLGFRVSRLMVIHGESGIPLFDYKFSEHNVDETLFSGLLQGLQQVSMEVLQKGALEEIRLHDGVLALAKYPRFTLGLLSARSSRFLARCLDQFARAFNARFHAQLETFGGDVGEFSDALVLVEKYFEYIPRFLPAGTGQ